MNIKIEILTDKCNKGLAYQVKKILDCIVADTELISLKRKIFDPETKESVGTITVEY